MIFVTVGTHEQQFNRLVKKIDDLKGDGTIPDEVVIQTGYSDYEPKNCEFSQLFSYQKMLEYVDEARIVITHGGPSSFIMPLQIGKIPIVVPRHKNFSEHFNDHQVDFCSAIAKKQGDIILVEDIDRLGDIITDYDSLVESMPTEMKSNNQKFCDELEKIVDSMFK